MIKAILIDDEWYNLEEIEDLVNKTGFIKVEGKYQNPLTALSELTKISPQIAFIDVEMPEMDGISLAERLIEKQPDLKIAFITAWGQYAVQAFDLNAFDYIMKPIKIDRFNKMIKKIEKEIGLKQETSSNILRINCFNQLEVSIDNKPVRWQRLKAEELFAYLIVNKGHYVHKDMIIENLWPEYEYAKALPILQTSICKIRNLFSSQKENVSIDYQNNKYCLDIKHAECDYLKLEKAITGFNRNKLSTFSPIEENCNLYCTGLFSQNGYNWSIAKDQAFKKSLIAVLKDISLIHCQRNDYERAIAPLKTLTELLPYDENTNFWLMKTYAKLDQKQEMKSHYIWLENILKSDYDSNPSLRIKEIVEAFNNK